MLQHWVGQQNVAAVTQMIVIAGRRSWIDRALTAVARGTTAAGTVTVSANEALNSSATQVMHGNLWHGGVAQGSRGRLEPALLKHQHRGEKTGGTSSDSSHLVLMLLRHRHMLLLQLLARVTRRLVS